MPTRIPADPENMNIRRSHAAERALLSFAKDFGETDDRNELGVHAEQNFVDLLADLAHYCDRQNLNMERCWNLASQHYAEETNDEGDQLLSNFRSDEEEQFDIADFPLGLRLYIDHLRSELSFRRWEKDNPKALTRRASV